VGFLIGLAGAAGQVHFDFEITCGASGFHLTVRPFPLLIRA